MNVVAFGTQAEFAEKYLSKGKSVRVYGEIDVRSYEDKQGQKKYITELIADKIQFVDSGSGGTKSGSAPTRQAPAPPARQQAAPQTRVEADPFADPEEEPF